MMRQFLVRKYGRDQVIINPAFLVAKGNIPVALIAHADTVFKSPPETFYYDKEKNVMWSPDGMGADDRAGIYSIIKLVSAGYRPHVIITTDEESGCLGATKLVRKFKKHPFTELKFMIQLDRRGTEDSVYYDCANPDFEKFINEFGFKTAYGSLSDISVLAPMWEIAAVNFSVGYKDEHSYQETLNIGAMFDTIRKVSDILTYVQEHPECPTYEYIEDPYYGYGSRYATGWWDDGYNLTPLKAGEDHCCFCGDTYKTEDMLFLWYDEKTSFLVCNACYATQYEEVEWCSHCQKGWFLTKEEKETLTSNEDRLKWKCRMCREDRANVRGNSTAVQPGACGIAEHDESADGQAVRKVDEREEELHYGHEWSGL